jgi:cyclopropane fatty-acyl-phospholipid synthase-like methyltransferase
MAVGNRIIPPPSDSAGYPGRGSWRARLHAWWEGANEPARPSVAPAAVLPPAPAAEPPTIAGWPERRRQLVERLFGAGMVTPGGVGAVHRLTEPLHLTPAMTVIELGAGLGGIARLLAREAGLWVTGFEPDAELAAAAVDASAREGLAKRAVIKCVPFAGLDLRPASIDAVVAKEALFTVADKPALFARLRRFLRGGAQISLSDYLRLGAPDATALRVWAAHEPVEPHLRSPQELRDMLERIGLEVRVMEDISADYRAAALAAFASMAQAMKGDPDAEVWRPWLVSEAEHWGRRLAALESGEMAVFRCYARMPGGG